MKILTSTAVSASLLASTALAQTATVAAPAPFLDLTGIAVATVGGFFMVLGTVAAAWIQSHVKDQAAAVTLKNAVANSLGAMQQAATVGVAYADPKLALPVGTSQQLAVGVQYVLDHAGTEASRLGITPAAVASKISAQIGLANIATNLATTSNATPASPAPLDPLPASAATAGALPPPAPLPVIAPLPQANSSTLALRATRPASGAVSGNITADPQGSTA